MKAVKLYYLVLILMLIITGCKKKEIQPPRQVTVGSEKKPVPKEPNQPIESLHEVAAAGDIDRIKSLIANGADVNTKDNGGTTPLHYAVIFAKKDVIEFLIANGADVNVKDSAGRTPMWWAKDLKNNELVELLLKHGANE